MAFRGQVLTVAALIDHANAAPPYVPPADVGVRHTAAGNAAECAGLLADGDSPDDCWRFGILQTLDDYNSTLRRGGPRLASQVFADEPAPTGSTRLDAAFAALADHLAQRDGWTAPVWADDPKRQADGWYPDVPAIFKDEADRDSPPPFRRRGVWITSRSLDRA
jgi:hypothetical protein